MTTQTAPKISSNISTPVNATFNHPEGGTVSIYLPNVNGDAKAAIKKLLQETIGSL